MNAMGIGIGWFRSLDGHSDDAARLIGVVSQEIRLARVLHLTNVDPGDDPLGFWLRVGSALGRHITFAEDSTTGAPIPQQWMDVRFEPNQADTFRHHNVGQPLHSDNAYSGDDGNIALFYMARQAAAGGASLFIDAETIAAIAEREDPRLFDALTTLTVRFGKPHHPGRAIPILRRDRNTLKVNWNYYRVLPDQGDEIAWLREHFREFLDRLVATGRVLEFTMRDGDAVIFQDEEVLHGRLGYEAQGSGDRLLWKTYFATRTPDDTA